MKDLSDLQEKTASSFGFEWTKFNDVFAEYEKNFLEYIAPIDRDFFKGKLVLDAGCGAGRHTVFAANYGADVHAFDLSDAAVSAAQDNTTYLAKTRVFQADMYTLPVAWPNTYDYLFCIGVLHHLPDPQEGFNRLVALVKEGGSISIWVYGRKDNELAIKLYEPIRKITKRIPHKVLYFLSLFPALLMETMNRLGVKAFSHYAQFPFRTKWNDVFDVFSAPSARYYDLAEIEKWFEQAGLKDIQVSYRMMDGVAKGIKGLGVK